MRFPMVSKRLSRDDRRAQLLAVALDMVRDEGVDALTLARVAERAGVSKPIAYDHFVTRTGLLQAIYLDYDQRQTAALEAALARGGTTPDRVADILANACVECALDAGPEVLAVAAALEGSAEMEDMLQSCRANLMEVFGRALAPFGLRPGPAFTAAFTAVLASLEALSRAVCAGSISRETATATLKTIILAVAADPPPDA